MRAVMDIQRGQDKRGHRGGGSLWSRLYRALVSPAHGSDVSTASGLRDDGSSSEQQPHVTIAPTAGGVILPFPVHGEALLVKLAEVLRDRIAGRGAEWEPQLVTMSQPARLRLSLDHSAYVEFHSDRAEYRAVIEASCETKVILETPDFDTLVDFVVQYIAGAPTAPATLETAS